MVCTGDTLFVMGCGRIFEGDADMMWASLEKLLALPDQTVIYCSHEYTIANAAFARSVDPDNAALAARQEAIVELRENGFPTVPTRLDLEKATNPFLRVDRCRYPRTSWHGNSKQCRCVCRNPQAQRSFLKKANSRQYHAGLCWQ